MPKQLRSAKIIIANTVVMLAFLLLLVAANVFFMNKINHDLMSVDEHQSQKLYLILQLEDIIRERSLSMMAIYMSRDPWFRDREYLRFQTMATKFISLRDQLRKIGLSRHEETKFNQLLTMIKRTEPLQNNIVGHILSDTPAKVRNAISKTDLPLETTLLKAIDRLTEEIRINGQKARLQARNSGITTLYFDIFASGLVLIGLFLLMRNSLYSLRDIETDLIKQTETLSWDATHDHLTQTLNRRGLQQKFSNILEHDTGKQRSHSLIFIDLDDFKTVNDQFGHDIGDQLLCRIAEDFQDCIRKDDSIARIGGDEFTLLLEDCDIGTADRISQCLLQRARDFSLQHNSGTIRISSCSIGVHVFTNTETDLDTLLKRADEACYSSKREGKNRITRFKSEKL